MNNSKATGAKPGNQWGVGDQADAPAYSTQVVGGRSVDLIQGEHPHSRSDDRTYARFKGRDSGGCVVGFSGHHQRWSVTIEEFNYMKESELSGDEVRRGCKAGIFVDGRKVYEMPGRDLLEVLGRVPSVVSDLGSLPFDLGDAKACIGRSVFYAGHPATVATVGDDGTVTLRTVDDEPFPRRPWDSAEDYEALTVIADDVLSQHIWWHRESTAGTT